MMLASAGLMPAASGSIAGTGEETCLSATVIGESPVYGNPPIAIW